MSYVKFMRTFRCFLELIGVPKTEGQGVKYNYILRFLPTLGEVLLWIPQKHSRSATGLRLLTEEIVGKPVPVIPHPDIMLVMN